MADEEIRKFIQVVDIRNPLGKFIAHYATQKYWEGFLSGMISTAVISSVIGCSFMIRSK